MADDKSKRGATDRARVSGSETYEVDYFAEKHGLTREEAQKLIDRVGNDRDALDAAASEQKNSGGASNAPASKRRKTAARAPKQSVAKHALTKSIGAVAATVDSAADAVVDPVAKATRPARRQVAALASNAAGKTRNAVGAASREVAKAPATLKREAGQATKVVATAASGRVASFIGAATAGLVAGVALGLNRKTITTATGLFGPMPTSGLQTGGSTSLAERIARVLAGTGASVNADGSASSAAELVNEEWRSHLSEAKSVLKTLRVPSSDMANAGDAQIWEAMVVAAIAESERL